MNLPGTFINFKIRLAENYPNGLPVLTSTISFPLNSLKRMIQKLPSSQLISELVIQTDVKI